MATRAFDLATILKAFVTLKENYQIENRGWEACNASQKEVFGYLKKYAREVARLKDLTCEVEFDFLKNITVTSILDKNVKWLDGIARSDKIINKGISYPAFKLKRGCAVFSVEGFAQPLLLIITKGGDKLWIMMAEKELEGLELVKMAFEVVNAKRDYHPEYISEPDAIMPKIDFKLEPDISFLSGAQVAKNCDNWRISNAKQEFKFRMNEQGARAVVRTTMVLLGSCVGKIWKNEEIRINRPFFGWFTQPKSDFPLAIFYADIDCWKDSGRLEDL